MLLTRLFLRFMSGEEIMSRISKNVRALNRQIGFEEAFILLDENYYMTVELLRRGRMEPKYIAYVSENIGEIFCEQY